MKLRLLVRPDCDRACPGCCNRQWDLNALPVCSDFSPYTEVMLTGGEPMIDYREAIRIARQIRRENPTAKLFMYTAKTDVPHELGWVLSHLDGITVTLHQPADVEPFLRFARYVALWKLHKNRLLRVNVFKPITLQDDPALDHWISKLGMEWIRDCPLPDGEVFMRTDHGWTRENIASRLNWTGQ